MAQREEAHDDGRNKPRLRRDDAYFSTTSTRVNRLRYIRRNPCFHDFLRHSIQSTAIRVWVIFIHGEVEPISTIDLSVYKSGADDVPLHVYNSVGPLLSQEKRFLYTIQDALADVCVPRFTHT